MNPNSEPERLILIDSNVFLHLEDYSLASSVDGRQAANVSKYAGMLGYNLALAQGTLDDLNNAGQKKELRLRQTERYPVIVPEGAGDLAQRAGFPIPTNDNDARDLSILSVLDQGLAAWLVTNDVSLRKRAKRAGIDRVVSISQMYDLLTAVAKPDPVPPAITTPAPSEINIDSPFFESLKASYDDFTGWWDKVVIEKRKILLLGDTNNPEGIAVLKTRDQDYGLPADTMKLCTFKINEDFKGGKRGELLLKAVFLEARRAMATAIFVEVAPGNELTSWAADFGLNLLPGTTADSGDVILVKHFLATPTQQKVLTPFEYNKQLGPHAMKIQKAYRVPIKSHWHTLLFPTTQIDEGALFPIGQIQIRPCGRAIKKVYVCNSPTRKLNTGDVLLFVESNTGGEIRNIGVVEEVLVTGDPLEVIEFASDRTVYTLDEIAKMSERTDVLAIKFRHARTLEIPLSPTTPGYTRAVGQNPPQSITAVGEEGIEWLRSVLDVPC